MAGVEGEREGVRRCREVDREALRNGGKPVTIHNDQFDVVGSVRVVLPGLCELHARPDRCRAVSEAARRRDVGTLAWRRNETRCSARRRC
jgi:hypothetical protein